MLGSYSIPPAPPAPDHITKLMQCEVERGELRKDLSRGQKHLTERLAKAYKPLLEREAELKKEQIALQKLKVGDGGLAHLMHGGGDPECAVNSAVLVECCMCRIKIMELCFRMSDGPVAGCFIFLC